MTALTRRHRHRLLTGVVLAAMAGVGLALATSPASADPTPIPAPTVPGQPTPPTNPTPTPNPTPQPTPGPSPTLPTDGGEDEDPAWYDIPGQIRKAITDFFATLVADNLTSVMAVLGSTVLATPDLTGNDKVRVFWTASLVTTNTVFVLFVVAAGLIVASRETLQTRYGLKQVLPRLAVGAVAANTSLLICEMLLEAANALTAAIAGQGVDGEAAGQAISQALKTSQYGNNFLLTLLALGVLVAVLVVVVMFLLRVAALVLLIGVAPMALICHALPQTEGMAYTWWRALGACLGIQVAQAVIILAAVKIFFTPAGPTILGAPATGDGILGVLVCLCVLWILIKIPGWAKQFVLGPLGQRSGRGIIGQLVHTYLTVKTLGAAAGIPRSAKAGRRAATTARSATSGTGTTPGTATRPAMRHRARPSRPGTPGPVRRTPAPAGPAPFSHSPTSDIPLAEPAGTAGTPSFSHAPNPTPSPAVSPPGPVPPAVFSSTPHPAASASPTPADSPAPVVFSHTSGHTARRAAGPPPAVTFSAVPQPHGAPRRPPAPAAPVFSSAPRPSPAPSTAAARRTTPRPTAARQTHATTPGTNRTPPGTGGRRPGTGGRTPGTATTPGTARTSNPGTAVRVSRQPATPPARPKPASRVTVPTQAPPVPTMRPPVPVPRPADPAPTPPVPAPDRQAATRPARPARSAQSRPAVASDPVPDRRRRQRGES